MNRINISEVLSNVMRKCMIFVLALSLMAGSVCLPLYETGVKAATEYRNVNFLIVNGIFYEMTEEDFLREPSGFGYDVLDGIPMRDEDRAFIESVLGDGTPDDITSASTTTCAGDFYSSDTVVNEGPFFTVKDGVLTGYSGTETVLQIPDTVKKIANLNNLDMRVRKIIIPDSVEKINKNAFSGFKNLKCIVFPKKKIDMVLGNTLGMCGGTFSADNVEKLENIVAPKGAWIREQALETGIPVTTTDDIQFEHKTYYMIKGITEINPILNSTGQKVKYKSNNSKVTIDDDGKMTAKKTGKATVTATLNGKSYTYKVVVKTATVKNRLAAFKKNYIKSGMSKYEKILIAHNWLIANAVYDEERLSNGTLKDYEYKGEGVLIHGTGVCESYTKAFSYLMATLKIPCKRLSTHDITGGHSWNIVKLDGKWYHVDTTYDDPILNSSIDGNVPKDVGISYEFFLKSQKYMIKYHSEVTAKTKIKTKAMSAKYDKMEGHYNKYSWTNS